MLLDEIEIRPQATLTRFEVEPNLHLLHRIDRLLAANNKLLDASVLSQVPLVSNEVLASHDRLHFILRSLNRLTSDLEQDRIKSLPKKQYSMHTVLQVTNSLFQKIPMNHKASHPQLSYGGFIKLLVEDYRPLFRFFCSQHHQASKAFIDRHLEVLGLHRQHGGEAQDPQADDTLEILAGYLKGKSQSVYERTKTFLNIDPIEVFIGSIDLRNYGNLDDLLASCESNISLVSSLVLNFQSHDSLPLTASELLILTGILCRLKNLLGSCKQTNAFEAALEASRSEDLRKAAAQDHMSRAIQSLEHSFGEKHAGQVTIKFVGELLDSVAAMNSSERLKDHCVSFILEVIKLITPSAPHKRALVAGLQYFFKLGDYTKEMPLFTKNEVFSQLIAKLDQSAATGEYEDKPFVEFLLSVAMAGMGPTLPGFLIEKIRKMTVTIEQCRWKPFERYLDLFLAHTGSSFGVEDALEVLASTTKLWVWTELSLKFAGQLSNIEFATLKKKFNLNIHPSKLSTRVHVVKRVNEEVIRTTYCASIRMPKTEKRLDFLDIIIKKLLSSHSNFHIEDYYNSFLLRVASQASTFAFKLQEFESFQTRLTFQSMFFKGLNKVLLPELAIVTPEEFKKQLSFVQQACQAYDIDFQTSFTGSTIKKSSQISALADESISKAISAVNSASNCLSLLEAMNLTEQPQQVQTLTKEILEKLLALQNLRTAANTTSLCSNY